mgnify:CR=1 FL=1
MIVPRQPSARVNDDFLGMAKQLQEIVKRADLIEFAGMNQGQVEIRHLSTVLRFEKERILPVQNGLFEGPFHPVSYTHLTLPTNREV